MRFLESIRTRLILIILFMSITPMVFVSIFEFNIIANELRSDSLSEQQLALSKQVNTLDKLYGEYRRWPLFLRDLPPVQGLIRSQKNGQDALDGSSYNDWIIRFQTIFKSLLEKCDNFYQIRFIDESGQEIVNVKKDRSGIIEFIKKEHLQNKRNEPYFSEINTLPKGEVYVSKLSLNREYGEIELPHRPTIRIATPVFASDTNERKGFIIINMDITVLDQLETNQGNMRIATQDGDFIYHENPSMLFGKELGTEINLFDTEPDIQASVKVVDEEFHYDSDAHEYHIWKKFYPTEQTKEQFWIFLYTVSESEMLESVYNVQKLTILMVIITISIGTLIAYAVATNISNPILSLANAAQFIAKGNMSTTIGEVKTYGEIALLGTSLTHMQEKYRELQNSMEDQITKRTKELETLLAKEQTAKTAMLNIMDDLENTRKSLEAQQAILQESEERFRGAFETSPIGISLVSPEGKWLKVNKGFCDIVGYTASELLSMNVQDITHPEDLPDDIKNTQKLVDGSQESYEIEKRYIHKLGNEIWVLRSVSLVRSADGKPLYFVTQIIDITQRKRVEEAKSNFVSLASHQLRTPLTALKWIIEAFRKGKVGELNEKQKELINDANTSALNMSETINTMLMLSRIEAGKLRVEEMQIDVDKLVQEICSEQEIQVTNKKQTVSISIEPNLQLRSDAAMLKEIVRNLLSNAIKYTPEKGKIIVTAQQKMGEILISVKDSGFGIPPEEQQKIFSKFFRASNVLNKETEGTGLGLYLVYSLTRMLQGSISFESKEDQGTTFFVTIPLTPPSAWTRPFSSLKTTNS